jgi:hypothetical protein
MGFIEALATVALLVAVLSAVASGLGYASAELLRSLAEVGVALLLAYIVEAVWLVNGARREAWHENWLGFISGIGFSGLLGIAAALATAAHREAGHGNFIDDIGLWWAVCSLMLLGVLVTSQPFMVDRAARSRVGHPDQSEKD